MTALLAALALLPAMAMMVTAGIAGASASVLPGAGAAAAGGPATAIELSGHRNVLANHAVTFSGRAPIRTFFVVVPTCRSTPAHVR